MSRRDVQLQALARQRAKVTPDSPDAAKLDAIEAVVTNSEDGASAEQLKAAVALVEQPDA